MISPDRLRQDIRYALRGMIRSPGFTTVAVASLALGIGANTAIFSLINTLMLRALPIERPGQIVEFLNQYPGDPPMNMFSRQSYERFRDQNHVFSGITGVRPSGLHVSFEGFSPEIVDGEGVVKNYFQLLGVKPAMGRLFGEGETESAAVVVSWSLWKRAFNLDPSILGRRVTVEGVPMIVAGVAPRDFAGMIVGLHPDIWVPATAGPMGLIARLRPGVSLAQARAEMAVLFKWTLDERSKSSKDPQMRRLRFEVEPAGAGVTTGLRYQFAKPLLALMSVVGLLLLIVCSNLANMLLARAATRRKEMAVRISLGASRTRLVHQVLTESVLLSSAGAALGVFLAYFGSDALARIMTSGRPMPGMARFAIHVNPDLQVLLFTTAIALLTGLLFGLAPAWGAFSLNPASSLRETSKATAGRFRRAFGTSLVVAQVALSVGLLSLAGLLIHHLFTLKNIDAGFRRDHVLLMKLDAARSGYGDGQLSLGFQQLLGRLAAIPGVHSATVSAPTPISGAAAPRFVTVEGYPERREERRYVSVAWVAPQYFETMRTPLLVGRDFNFGDRSGQRVAIVNQAMARHYFAGTSPIGKHLTFDGDAAPYEIVGVAGDAKYAEIREAAPRTIYLNTFQSIRPASDFAIRTSVTPETVGPAVRRAVQDALKTVSVARMTTLDDQVDASLVPERLTATLSGLFGGLGALLAAIGVYGLLAFTVAGRTNEIGIRMALGASRGVVSRMVLCEVLHMTCGGLLIGTGIAWWAGRFARSLIENLASPGALPMSLAALTMVAVSLLAAWIPVRRAASVDPAQALRDE